MKQICQLLIFFFIFEYEKTFTLHTKCIKKIKTIEKTVSTIFHENKISILIKT